MEGTKIAANASMQAMARRGRATPIARRLVEQAATLDAAENEGEQTAATTAGQRWLGGKAIRFVRPYRCWGDSC